MDTGSHFQSRPVVDVAEFRINEVGEAVLNIFREQCSKLQGKLRKGETGSSLVEIECRLGEYDSGSKCFVSGISKQEFRVMLRYFGEKMNCDKWKRADDNNLPVKMSYTDHIDVVFKSGVRVTCKVLPGYKTNFEYDVYVIGI